MTCTYTFTDPAGKKLTITGKNAFKAYLANGGLQHLAPGRAAAFNQTDTPAFKRWFGDSKAEAPKASARSDTIAQRTGRLNTDGLRKAVAKGALSPVVSAMIDNGIIVLHDTTATLPDAKARKVRGVQAITTADGKIHLVAANLTAENAQPVLWHEMFHKGGERLIGSKEWGNLMGRGASLFRQAEQSTGKNREFFDKVRARVAAAKRQGAVKTGNEVEEFLAYAIEEYETAPASIRKWVDDVIGLIKAWFQKTYGKQLGALTPAQLSAMAKMALMDVAADRRGEMFGTLGTVFSATEQTNTPAFKRWFGDSKVVDAEGRPLVVYHGTASDITAFDIGRSGESTGNTGFYGAGAYFSEDADYASGFSFWARRSDDQAPNVVPVYLSLKNPAYINITPRSQAASEKSRATAEKIISTMIARGTDKAVVDKLQGFVSENKFEPFMGTLYNALGGGTGTTALLKEAGFDGVTIYGGISGKEKLAEAVAFDPTQIKSAIGNNGDFDPTNPDIRYSVTPERAETIIDEANAALKASKTSGNYIGSVAGDLGWYMRLFGHPRQVAAVHREFVPSYKTAISQQETRDKIISQFGDNFRSYHDLDQAGKENVNKVLELGRLTSQTYTAEELANGVGNPGEKSTVVMVDGKPQIAKEPMTAMLTEVGEVVKLSEDEIAAYRDLRSMFDDALDQLRDQTLTEMGFEQFAGEKNAAKAIIATITDATSEDQAERLKNVAAFVGEIEQAKRSGYVPFARYGDYVVTVKEKIADVEYLDDVDGYKIARGLPDSFAPDMLEMGAEQTKEGWRITPNQIKDVNRLTEKTVYSEKVELPLTEKLLKERKDVKYTDIPSVGEAYNKAVNEWEAGNQNRKTYVFPVRERKTEKTLKLSDVMSLAEVSGLDNATMDRMRDAMSDAIKAKGFRRHFLHSDNIPGYTGDFERSMADYIIGMGGYLSRRQHMSAWDRAVEATKNKSTLHEFAMRYRDYVNDPQEELAMIRQIGFLSYIAGVAASAFANLTQVPLLTVPTLAQIAPLPLVLKEVGRAYVDAFKMVSLNVGLEMFDPRKAPEDKRDIINEAWDEGLFVPLETIDLMMTARQRNVGARKGVKAFNTFTQISSVSFTFAERMNRLVTFIAAARLAEKRAVKENAKRVLTGDALAESQLLRNWGAKSLAEWAVDESQYRMGKSNRPTTMRGVGAAIMQFKGFMLQTFEAWYRMAALHGGKEGKLAAAASIAAMASLAGVWGLPGADDLRKLIEAVYKQITDKDLDLKTELRAWVARTSGSNAVAQIVNKGVTYPYGIDLTRVGMGSIVPDSPLAAAGIPFDMLIGRPKRAFEKGSTGDYLGAAGEFTPNFIKNALIAISWTTQGVRDKRGNMLLPPEDIEMSDWTKKALGFQPSVVSDVRDYEYAQRRTETAVDALKRNYTNKIARLEYQLDTTSDPQKADEIQKRIDAIYDQIDEHNENAPEEHQIEISDRTLRQKIEREEEGVRATWGKERKAARDAAEDLRRIFGLSD